MSAHATLSKLAERARKDADELYELHAGEASYEARYRVSRRFEWSHVPVLEDENGEEYQPVNWYARKMMDRLNELGMSPGVTFCSWGGWFEVEACGRPS